MTYSINITLTPKNNPNIDLGDTPCEWSRCGQILSFLDAPYGFYDLVDETFGYSQEPDSTYMRFVDWFFDQVNTKINRFGMDDGVTFVVNEPNKYFGVSFRITISADTE